jgi:hypothetical protein
MMRLFFGVLLIANAALAYMLMQEVRAPAEKPTSPPIAEIAFSPAAGSARHRGRMH